MSGTVETTCPYCGETVDVSIDEGGADHQEYVEDCPVCCRPWQVVAARDLTGGWYAELRTADE